MSGGGGRASVKELTLHVDVTDNKVVKAQSIIDELENVYGTGSVLAVVPRSGNLYEITVKDKESADDLAGTGFKVGDSKYECHAVYSSQKVVSFLHLPEFIEDDVVVKKLTDLGVEVLSKVKNRVHPGTKVHDGTRYVFCKFPSEITSLPYSMRFEIDKDKFEYIRVRHDNQSKVCSQCLSDTHLYVDCPQNKCYRCNVYGHIARFCPAEPCIECGYFPNKCRCGENEPSHEAGWKPEAQTSNDNSEINVKQVDKEMDRINRERKRRQDGTKQNKQDDDDENTNTKVRKCVNKDDNNETIPVVEMPDGAYEMKENQSANIDDGLFHENELDVNKNNDNNLIINTDDMPLRDGPFSQGVSLASDCEGTTEVDSAIEGQENCADTAESMEEDLESNDGESHVSGSNKTKVVYKTKGKGRRRRRLVTGLNKTPEQLIKLKHGSQKKQDSHS